MQQPGATQTDAPEDDTSPTSATAISRGRPSYSWRFGQDRRLEMVRQYVDLDGARILDIGCGIGTYVRRFRQYSDEVYGVEVEAERVAEASLELPNIQLGVWRGAAIRGRLLRPGVLQRGHRARR